MIHLDKHLFLDLISGKLSLPSQEEMQAHYEADRAENATFTHPFQMVRYQGRYANRLAELTGAVKNGDQCGKFKKKSMQTFCYLYDRSYIPNSIFRNLN